MQRKKGEDGRLEQGRRAGVKMEGEQRGGMLSAS